MLDGGRASLLRRQREWQPARCGPGGTQGGAGGRPAYGTLEKPAGAVSSHGIQELGFHSECDEKELDIRGWSD